MKTKPPRIGEEASGHGDCGRCFGLHATSDGCGTSPPNRYTYAYVAGKNISGGVHQRYLESVGPAASAGLLELASLGAHVRLDGVVGVQVVDAENAVSKTAGG